MDWVREKLDAIDEQYPPERVAASKERWTRMWNGEKPLDRHPFAFAPISVNWYGVPESWEEWLRDHLDDILSRKDVLDDFIPTLWVGCRQSIMPSIFGAPEVKRGEGKEADYCCKRILREVADIDALPEPSIQPGTPAREVVSLQQYLLEETEGRIPIHVVDMQGPADVSGKMWGYDNLYLCAQDQPEAYHRLMTKVAEGFIFFWKRQQEILGDCFVNTHLMNWMPRSAGATASFDSMVMISPPFYEEFYLPYVMKIGEAFGGITIHACGQFPALVEHICRTPFLKGFNTSEMSLDVVLAAGLDRSTVVSTCFQLEDVEKWFDCIRRNSIRCDSQIYGLWPSQDPVSWTDSDWQQIHACVGRVHEAAHL